MNIGNRCIMAWFSELSVDWGSVLYRVIEYDAVVVPWAVKIPLYPRIIPISIESNRNDVCAFAENPLLISSVWAILSVTTARVQTGQPRIHGVCLHTVNRDQ